MSGEELAGFTTFFVEVCLAVKCENKLVGRFDVD